MPFRDDNIGVSESIESRKPGSKRNVQKDKRNKKRGKGKGKGTSGTGVKYSIVGNIITLSAGQDNPANELTSDLVGATISVSNPHTILQSDLFTTANGFTLPTSYSTQISKVVNSKTFEVVEPYYVTDRNGKRFAASLNPGSITITYDTFKTETEDSVFQRSYANLTIGNLRTFSGDVYKAKIYYRPSLATTDFEEIYDTFVVPENVLVDSNSLNQFENIGFFHTGSIVANNWVSSSTTTQTSPFVTLTNEKLIDGLEISGSVSKLEDKVNFRTKNSFDLENGVDYVVRFNSYYYKSISEKRDTSDSISDKSHASLKVFLSGSALTGNSGESDFFLGEVDVPDTSADEGLVENVIGRFRSSGDGSPKAWLKFELNSGRFHIQDVSVEPFSETNFNPSFFKVLVPIPIPQGKRVDKYDFLVEFYDSNNNLAETTAQINGVQFLGPRQVIADGLDAVFSGSMVIGESMEMFGVNPAYLRSVGYQGFDKTIFSGSGGFMMFSGSVGSRITASESYEGVGLEIVDAHGDTDRFLKFRTNPSEFTVQTDQFFFGKEGQFISGSNGNIIISSSNFFLGDENSFVSGSNDKLEISSSNFHLTNGGEVIVGKQTGTESNVLIDNNSVDIRTGANVSASFGANTTIGPTSGQHVSIDSDSFDVKSDSSTTLATFGSTTTIGSAVNNVNIDSDSINLVRNSQRQIRLTNGLVTIGTGSSAQILIDTVGGSAGIQVRDRDNEEIAFIGESAAILGRTSAGSPLPTTNAIRGIVTDGLTGNILSITGSANVGGLVVSGSVRNTSNGAATSVLIHAKDNSNTLFQVLTDGEVLARDNITAFKTSGFSSISDERLKTDIQSMSQSLDRVLKLEPKNFSWIENNEKDSGFIAQDVEKVIPEVVQETKGFVDIDSDENEDTKYKTISYSKLTIYLVDAIKELTKRIEDLEERFVKK